MTDGCIIHPVASSVISPVGGGLRQPVTAAPRGLFRRPLDGPSHVARSGNQGQAGLRCPGQLSNSTDLVLVVTEDDELHDDLRQTAPQAAPGLRQRVQVGDHPVEVSPAAVGPVRFRRGPVQRHDQLRQPGGDHFPGRLRRERQTEVGADHGAGAGAGDVSHHLEQVGMEQRLTPVVEANPFGTAAKHVEDAAERVQRHLPLCGHDALARGA